MDRSSENGQALILRRPLDGEATVLAALAARCQADPEQHIPYLGFTADSIETDIGQLANWTECSVVAQRQGDVVGFLIAEVDDDMGRLWWWGPFIADDARADWSMISDRLYERAREQVADRVDEEEACGDDRSILVRDWCDRHRLVPETASVLLRRAPDPATTIVGPSNNHQHRVRPLTEADHRSVMDLHNLAFPGTHTTPEALIDSENPVLVIDVQVDDSKAAGGDAAGGHAVGGYAVGGYIAYELQSDGSGYIDYLAVEAKLRGRGLGAALVETACAKMFEDGVRYAHLTVREDNAAARALYASLGFAEDRLARPYRLGFQLD